MRNALISGRTVARAAVLASVLALPVPAAASPDEVSSLGIHVDAGRRVITLDVGPLSLPGGGSYDGTVALARAAGTSPVAGWLRGFAVQIVDAEGRPAHGARLHHTGLFAPGERDVFSPVMRRIVAFGSETAPISLPGRLGYRVARGDSLLLIAALFNPTDEDLDAVYLRMTITYADAQRRVAHRDVLPLYLDVLPAGHRVFDVPPGGVSVSAEWSPAVPGRILALGGHLHQHGVSVMLEDLTSGRTIWIGSGLYDEEGELVGVTRKIFLRGVRIDPSHRYRITAVYRNPGSEPIRGAMGKIGGLFLPDGRSRVPRADRSDPDYALDLAVHLAAEHAHHH